MKKLLALLSASFMLATCAACSCDSEYLNGSDSPSASDTTSDTTPNQSDTASPIALQTPMHLSFDEENYTLTWDPVDNAVCYLIDHNGEIIENSETQVYVLTQEGENTFKVKAVGDGVNYTDSNWSEEYCYVMPAQVSVYEKVNTKIAEIAKEENLKLEKIIGVSSIYLTAGSTLIINIRFCTICTDTRNVSSFYEFSFHHENPLSLGTILETFDSAIYKGKAKRVTVDYQSAEYLVRSKAYVGTMQEYYQRGFEISVMQSAVLEGKKVGSKFRFELIGTFKAQNGNTVEYFTAYYAIDILLPSVQDKYNYQTLLSGEEDRIVNEYYCVIYDDYQSIEYISDWAKENDPNYQPAK